MPLRIPWRKRRNPRAPRPDLVHGARAMDDVTGAWTREKRLVKDPYGNMVDPRLPGSYDFDETRGGRQ